MNNIESIKEDYNVGDPIRIVCSLGIKEGYIVDFKSDRIKIQPFEDGRKPISIAEESIKDFEEALPSKVFLSESKVVSNSGKDYHSNILSINEEDCVYASSSEIKETIEIQSQDISKNNEVATLGIDEQIKEPNKNVANNEIKPVSTSSTSAPSYKPGDKVDPSVIQQWEKENRERIKQELKKCRSKQKKSPTKTLASLQDLGSVFDISKVNEAENMHVVREMGKILSFGGEFGFISDNKTGDQIWFGGIELLGIDPTKEKVPGMYVVYSRSFNYKGSTAVSIHKPDTIANLLLLVEDLAKKTKFDDAIEVLSHITSQFPNNFSALQKRKEIDQKKLYAKYNYNYSDNNYFRQAITYRQNKDFVNAIESYKQAIENNQNVESSIKDLMGLYLHMLKNAADQTAYDKYLKETKIFTEQYVKKLSKNINNLSQLENFYFALKDYVNFKKISNLLLQKNIEDKQRVNLLCKIASLYLKEGDKEKARKFLGQAAEIEPTNNAVDKLFDILDNSTSNKDEIDTIINQISDFAFVGVETGGLSTYIEATLDNYKEYAGVHPKVRETGDFKKKDLNDLRDFIANNFDDKSFAGRASDRARYLLTEGKLMQMLEPGETFKLRSAMARYCNDMAKIHIYDSSSMDVVRFFYRESFYLEKEYKSTARQVSYYLLTTIYDNKKMASELGKNYSVDNALKTVLQNRPFDQRQWENILCMFLDNPNITVQVLKKIYDDKELLTLSLNALKYFGIDNSIVSEDDYKEAWREAITSRKNKYSSVISKLEILGERNTIEEVSKYIVREIKDLKQDWMCPLDDYRLDRIRTEIAPVIEKYINAIGYRNKELYKHEAENIISKQIIEITENPTKLSFEGCLPLLKKLLVLITDSFADIQAASEPVINIIIERTENLVIDDILTLQIEVSLDKDSSPINNVSIKVIDNKNIELINPGENNPLPRLLEGGDKHTFFPTVKVTDSVLENKAVAFDVICEYNKTYSNTVKSQKASLSLHLYKEEDFQTIYNPYAPVAESGPLKADSEMFYGHQRFIEGIVSSIMESPSKQVIIFGQKRSGKSSVLNRVELGLQKANAFCIKFSMGKIVKNISECAFYYKILTELDSNLEDLRDDGEIVPEFIIPSKNDFQNEDLENPLETFTKYMRAFKKSCQKTEGWKDKRLVVLIDEFTYMYGAIKMGNITPTIMQQWKAITQDEKAQFSVVLVGQDVVPAFKNEPYARNAFGVIKDIRLSYLEDADAKELIEKPILDSGKSRYIGGASELIMDYTACNPYYIQIFCSSLVNYMNEKHLINITEADVLNVANYLTKGPSSLDKAKFENLLSARETDGDDNADGDKIDDAIRMFQDADVETVLYAIARASQNTPWANRDDIKTPLAPEVENGILTQLASRDVIEKRENDNILRIKVRLYKEWLLNH